MVGVLNDGYRRGGRVYRMGGSDNSTLFAFQVFCPKAFAGLRLTRCARGVFRSG
jgi:hypothetical protein